MIEKFCDYLTNKIRNKMPEVDNEKAEVIKYGLELMVGEIPKFFILAAIAWLFRNTEVDYYMFYINATI